MAQSAKDAVAVVEPEPADHAWWLRTQFKAMGQAIRGIPVEALDPSWRRASEFTKAAIPRELLFKLGRDAMEENGLVFSRTGDFTSSGVEDLALVGVFQDKDDGSGNFLLILRGDAASGWRKTFLQSRAGHPGFVALARDAKGIALWTCMECDNGPDELRWDANTGSYQWVEPPPEEAPPARATAD